MRLPFRFRLDLATQTIALELEPLPEDVSCSPPPEGTDYKTVDVPLDGETEPAKLTLTADGLITRVEVPGLWKALLAGLNPQPEPKGKPGKPGKDRLL